MQVSDIRLEWRIADIERDLRQKQDKYEKTEADRNVDRLEHSVRELSSTIDGLRYELQALQDQVNQLKEQA